MGLKAMFGIRSLVLETERNRETPIDTQCSKSLRCCDLGPGPQRNSNTPLAIKRS